MTESELTRPHPILPVSSSPDIFSSATAVADRHARVAQGLFDGNLPVAGMTLGEFRARYGDRYDIDPDSMGHLDGRPFDENTVIGAGQTVTFTNRTGEKG